VVWLETNVSRGTERVGLIMTGGGVGEGECKGYKTPFMGSHAGVGKKKDESKSLDGTTTR